MALFEAIPIIQRNAPEDRSPRCRCVRRPFIQRRFAYTSIQRHLPSLVLFLAALRTGAGGRVVVFNEVMYHPATNEAALEWLELHNQNAVDVEISGWRLRGAINYEFAEGTIIRAAVTWSWPFPPPP